MEPWHSSCCPEEALAQLSSSPGDPSAALSAPRWALAKLPVFWESPGRASSALGSPGTVPSALGSPGPALCPWRSPGKLLLPWGSTGTASSTLKEPKPSCLSLPSGGVLAQLALPLGESWHICPCPMEPWHSSVHSREAPAWIPELLGEPWHCSSTPGSPCCRAPQHLAKPLWLPAVHEGFSPLSWSRAVASGKFLFSQEAGAGLAVEVCSQRELVPPHQATRPAESCPQQPPLLTQPPGQVLGDRDMLPAQSSTRFCCSQPQLIQCPPRAPQAAAAALSSGLCHAQGAR